MGEERVPGGQHSEAQIMLGVLNAIEVDSGATQRVMSRELGIALGLTNAYLKRCVRKGYVKVSQAPANRYAYYLTPKGFAEKSRLTAQYLVGSFHFYRGARRQCSDVFAECARNGWRRVLLVGVSDLAEIATLCAGENEATLVGIFDPTAGETTFAGLSVVRQLDDAKMHDAVVVTDLEAPQATFDRLVRSLPAERVLAPDLLRISRMPPNLTR